MSNLYLHLKRLIINNTSLVLIIIGSLSSFLLILFLKKYLPETFNAYSLYITFLSITVSFGYAGFDQVFLRHSFTQDGEISVSKDIVKILLALLFLMPLLFSYYFQSKFTELDFLLLYLSGLSINLILLAYNLTRLNHKFFIAQAFNSGYKSLFFLAIVIFYLLYPSLVPVHKLILLSTTILAVIGIVAVYYILHNLKVTDQRTISLGNYFFSFCLNLALLTLLTYGERILIANELGENVFGMYFYYSTVFLFPLTLIQYYVGFKELVFFKTKVDKHNIIQKIKKVFFLGLLLILFIFLIVMVDNGLFLDIEIKENLLFIALLSILGLVKLNYGLFSALLGAKGEFKDVYMVNVITFILMLLFAMILFFVSVNIELVITALIIIFLSRIVFIYRKYVH